MAACTESNGGLEGRYRNDNAALTFPGGDFAISLTSPSSFSGFYTADDPEFPGQFAYTGTFASHFPADSCCEEPPPFGGSLDPPTQMCGASEETLRRTLDCVPRDFLEFDAKGQARSQLRQDLKRPCSSAAFTRSLPRKALREGSRAMRTMTIPVRWRPCSASCARNRST
jgi:hypothetical protein